MKNGRRLKQSRQSISVAVLNISILGPGDLSYIEPTGRVAEHVLSDSTSKLSIQRIFPFQMSNKSDVQTRLCAKVCNCVTIIQLQPYLLWLTFSNEQRSTPKPEGEVGGGGVTLANIWWVSFPAFCRFLIPCPRLATKNLYPFSDCEHVIFKAYTLSQTKQTKLNDLYTLYLSNNKNKLKTIEAQLQMQLQDFIEKNNTMVQDSYDNFLRKTIF